MEEFHVGDRVQIRLNTKTWKSDDWLNGTIVRIEPYSEHRGFHWVDLDEDAYALMGIRQISVFNPKNIRKNLSDDKNDPSTS